MKCHDQRAMSPPSQASLPGLHHYTYHLTHCRSKFLNKKTAPMISRSHFDRGAPVPRPVQHFVHADIPGRCGELVRRTLEPWLWR